MSAIRKKRMPESNADETRDIFALIEEVIPDWPMWVDDPNAHFGTKTPRQAIKDGEDRAVRNLVLCVKYGMFS